MVESWHSAHWPLRRCQAWFLLLISSRCFPQREKESKKRHAAPSVPEGDHPTCASPQYGLQRFGIHT